MLGVQDPHCVVNVRPNVCWLTNQGDYIESKRLRFAKRAAELWAGLYFLPRLLGRARRLPLYVGLFGPRPLLLFRRVVGLRGVGGVFSVRRSTSSGLEVFAAFMGSPMDRAVKIFPRIIEASLRMLRVGQYLLPANSGHLAWHDLRECFPPKPSIGTTRVSGAPT